MSPIRSDTPTLAAYRKPWSRRKSVAVGCSGVFAALLVVVLGYLGWANYLPPLEPEHVVLPRPNGYDAVAAAIARLAADTPSPVFGDPAGTKPEVLRRAVAPGIPALSALRAAFRLEYQEPPLLPGESRVQQTMELDHARMVLMGASRAALSAGDAPTATDYALDLIELGVLMDRGGGADSLGQLFTSHGRWAAVLCLNRLDAKGAEAAALRLERVLARVTPYAQMVETERRAVLQQYRSLACSREICAKDYAEHHQARWWAYRWLYPKSRTYDRLDVYYRDILAELRKPFPQRRNVHFPAEPYLTDFFPIIDSFDCRLGEVPIMIRLLCLDLKLRAYQQRHHHYPAALTEVSRYLAPSVSQDPITGQPFVYRRKGAGYLLYSVGADLRDDGGHPGPGGIGFFPGYPGDVPSPGSTELPPMKRGLPTGASG